MSNKVTYFLPDCVGFVERLEVFGSDLTVVNAARVSFNKEVSAMATQDKKLIAYLAKHDHISPFFHPQIRMRLKMPIFVAREWFRHTVGFSRNEVSRRYVDSQPQCWIPSPESIRERDPKLKQGSKATPVAESYKVYEEIAGATAAAMETYNNLLKEGVAPEVARCILPQSMYTEFIETGSLYAYARLCALRLDPGAQVEIRRYATLIDKALSIAFPVSWAALRDRVVAAAPAAAAPAPAPVAAAPAASVPVPNLTGLTTLERLAHPATPLYHQSC
jgi:thymidylate synthase (FAD)